MNSNLTKSIVSQNGNDSVDSLSALSVSGDERKKKKKSILPKLFSTKSSKSKVT